MKGFLSGIALLALFSGVTSAESPRVNVAYVPDGVVRSPHDAGWDDVPAGALALSAQLISTPNGGGSVESVSVRAMHDGEWLAVRLDWADASADRSVGAKTFRDAMALGFPVRSGEAPPSPFMGDAEHPVNIWQWSADLEADAEGQGGFAERYPHTEGVWYFPQDASVRREVRAWRGVDPVVEFEATGWGTLTRHESQNVLGSSEHEKGRWRVLLRRRLATGFPEDVAFRPGEETQLIVAIWNGAEGEVNGRKSVTLGWTPFLLEATTLAGDVGR